MKPTPPSRSIKLCGTEQVDVVGQTLRAGPLTVELDNGNLRYLKVAGVEVLRSLSFLVRDENWGTYIPTLTDVKVEQRADGFWVSYRATCRRGDMEIGYDARIEGRADGSLEFIGVATPKSDFLTARTGFVVLHPLQGVVGNAVEVEHVDGKVEKSKFPEQVNPVQPFLHIRSLTHQVLPGLKAIVRMEGDTWEMEDHRNWTDASFKTYVRPLALPWPYTLKAGETVKQSVTLTLVGAPPKAGRGGARNTIEVDVGGVARGTMPLVGLGVPAEEIGHAVARLDLLKLAAPRLLICHFDPRAKHGKTQLYGYRLLCEQTGAQCELEIVVESVDRYHEELQRVAALVRESGLRLSAVAVCPVGDLKSVLPGGPRPPAPPLEELYKAAREAFPGVKLGGGMFSFFTELNRKRPPAHLLDFVHNSTCPIVHAADDRSVMETHEALPYQVQTARSYIGKAAYRIGPSAIGCRDNPHGKTFTPNPKNERICLVQMDPRQRGLFGAAWSLAYISSFAPTGVESVCLGAPTGPLGVIYRKTDYAQPWYDALTGPAVYPAFHVLAGLTRAAGARLVSARSSDAAAVRTLAYQAKGATLLWLANLTAAEQTVAIRHAGSAAFASMLDEASFERAASEPRAFQRSAKALAKPQLKLGAYAVGIVAIND
jgi:D-apionolactonase